MVKSSSEASQKRDAAAQQEMFSQKRNSQILVPENAIMIDGESSSYKTTRP